MTKFTVARREKASVQVHPTSGVEGSMAEWVRLCAAAEVPGPGKVGQFAPAGVDVCLANVDGELSAMDNWCPHRQGPLGEGWIEGNTVVCPWHAWAFDCRTGDCQEENSRVKVFPVKQEGGDVLVDLH